MSMCDAHDEKSHENVSAMKRAVEKPRESPDIAWRAVWTNRANPRYSLPLATPDAIVEAIPDTSPLAPSRETR